jgi:hypothetical protein
MFTFSLVNCLETTSVHDGEVLQLQPKELGRIEIRPQLLKHNPNGRYPAYNTIRYNITLCPFYSQQIISSHLSHSFLLLDLSLSLVLYRSVVVCGDGEYTIYTALKWRNQTYGNALDFVWGNYKSSYVFSHNHSFISQKIFPLLHILSRINSLILSLFFKVRNTREQFTN